MSRNIVFVILAAIGFSAAACDPPPPPTLPEGKWSGVMIPADNPSDRSAVYYRLQYAEGGLAILVGMSGMDSQPAESVLLSADSLKFVFEHPEAGHPMRCALGSRDNGSYEGPCVTPDGSSTYFTMVPPDPFGGQEA